MAQTISQEMIPSITPPIVGKQLLDVVSSGMYNDPLMVIREYVQNSVDAIDAISETAGNECHSKISIDVDSASRRIRVHDNGIGIPNQQILQLLCGLGVSSKDSQKNRGFRGIGRFGGLGYATHLIFETRSKQSEPVACVTWDCGQLARYIRGKGSLGMTSLLNNAVSTALRKATPADPPHFFTISMEGVSRFHRDALMDIGKLREYLSQVAPVPYNATAFPFTNEIQDHLSIIEGFKSYNILLNGETITRPYSRQFDASQDHKDEIGKIHLLEFLDDEDHILARGWFALTSFLSSLPTSSLMRGIRVRQGNIQIGDEYFLADMFSERRFSTWHIGELHVTHLLRPNARRDGFEQSPHYEKFLEHVNLLGRHLSILCRDASKHRSSRASRHRRLHNVEDALGHIRFFIDHDHFEKTAQGLSEELDKLESSLSGNKEHYTECDGRIEHCRRNLRKMMANPRYLHDQLDGRSLRNIEPEDLILQICSGLMRNSNNKIISVKTIHDVLRPYLKG
jgi:molecular chaperone HtpG